MIRAILIMLAACSSHAPSGPPFVGMCGDSPAVVGHGAVWTVRTGAFATSCTVVFPEPRDCVITSRDFDALTYTQHDNVIDIESVRGNAKYDLLCTEEH